MNLNFNPELSIGYHSKSQVARVLTENWVARNMYCPRCGNRTIRNFENNRSVADFYCPQCDAQYELKSKDGRIGDKINDGAYDAMISRISSRENPDFFFMSYSYDTLSVKSFILVPKCFFTPNVIEKRKPLSPNARRAGWIGCNILLNRIPTQGRISIVTDGYTEDRDLVVRKTNNAQRLSVDNLDSRGWLFDVLNCVNAIHLNEFTLADVYRFEDMLAKLHSDNNIRPKIRQQLQVLRDKGVILFLGNGKYKKKW